LFVRIQTKFVQRKSNSIPTREACPIVITTASPVTSDPGSEVEGLGGAASNCYIRHSTSDGTSGSMASTAICSCKSEWQTKDEQIKALQEKAP
jgi:hypothetical protein